MENIGNSGVSGNRITSKYTYLGNSPEFRVVLEPWERILTVFNIQQQVQAALEEWETGTQIKHQFTESANHETYREHVAAIQAVKTSENSQSKYERLLSTIYTQTM